MQKTLLAIPTVKTIQVEFQRCLMQLLAANPGTDYALIDQASIHVAREYAVVQMRKGGYDSILFLDSDMTFSPDLLDKLRRHDAPVTSAMCVKRVEPYTPCFYQELGYADGGRVTLVPFEPDSWPDKPFTAAAVGAACLLIKAEVFQRIKYPWFLPLPNAGEDITFCLRVQAAGIPILIDPDPILGHLETRPVTLADYIKRKRGAISLD